MPEIMGGGGNDFVASAVYDAFFQLRGLLGGGVTLVGSLVVMCCSRPSGSARWATSKRAGDR